MLVIVEDTFQTNRHNFVEIDYSDAARTTHAAGS